jgi:hypothetical protein
MAGGRGEGGSTALCAMGVDQIESPLDRLLCVQPRLEFVSVVVRELRHAFLGFSATLISDDRHLDVDLRYEGYVRRFEAGTYNLRYLETVQRPSSR